MVLRQNNSALNEQRHSCRRRQHPAHSTDSLLYPQELRERTALSVLLSSNDRLSLIFALRCFQILSLDDSDSRNVGSPAVLVSENHILYLLRCSASERSYFATHSAIRIYCTACWRVAFGNSGSVFLPLFSAAR